MTSEQFLVELLLEWRKILDNAHLAQKWDYDIPSTLAFNSMMIELILQIYKNEHRLGQQSPSQCAQQAFENCLNLYQLAQGLPH